VIAVKEPAEQASSARATVLVEAVTHLSWLAPSASSLATLGRMPTPSVWTELRKDPGAVLLLVRQPILADRLRGNAIPDPSLSLSSLLQHPSLLDDVLRQLRLPPRGVIDWRQTPAHGVYQVALTCAHLARALAEQTAVCLPEKAWICGLLAPLGWLALCACAPAAVAALTGDRSPVVQAARLQDRLAGEPPALRDWLLAQRQHWGLDQAALARRLARRWGLPGWLTAVVGHLGLPEELARTFGAETPLFHVARAAIGLAQDKGQHLGLLDPALARASAEALALPPALVEGEWVVAACIRAETEAAEHTWDNPYTQPLLADLLAVAADCRRQKVVPEPQRLEEEIDRLQRALEEAIQGEAARLQASKLEALAEFAAGAGHEINNPLAVISGQAQLLLSHEASWFTPEAQPHVRKALQAVVAQTRRMHSLLRDLMQFARPPAPCLEWVDLPMLLGEVAASLHELAGQRRVGVEVNCSLERFRVRIDCEQVRLALTCLLRNAIEAVPADGWARLALLPPVAGKDVEVAVEDSGPGPEPAQRPHLFDPFYSGRSAGRGRGLGLPIAWRLARQHGGDVRLTTPVPHQPTRFILTLPWQEPPAQEPELAPVSTGRLAS